LILEKNIRSKYKDYKNKKICKVFSVLGQWKSGGR
jgi:hypothetical protein